MSWFTARRHLWVHALEVWLLPLLSIPEADVRRRLCAIVYRGSLC